MDEEFFIADPYLTVKGDFRLIKKGRALDGNKVPTQQGVWGMTTMLFSQGSAQRVQELIRSAEAEFGSLDGLANY